MIWMTIPTTTGSGSSVSGAAARLRSEGAKSQMERKGQLLHRATTRTHPLGLEVEGDRRSQPDRWRGGTDCDTARRNILNKPNQRPPNPPAKPFTVGIT